MQRTPDVSRRSIAPPAASRARVRGCTGNTTGASVASAHSPLTIPARRAGSSTFDGRCRVTSMYSRSLDVVAAPHGALPSRASNRRSESIMVLPTKRTRLTSMPSRARLSSASGLCVSSKSDRRSVRTRLISSGIVQSPDRRPASRWTIGIPSFDAASAQASVEFTSPATTTTAGRLDIRISSNAIRTLPVCSPCVPEPTPSE